MECITWECSLQGPRAAWGWVPSLGGLGRKGQPLSLSLSWRLLSSCHPALGPSALTNGSGFKVTPDSTPRAEPSQAESPGFVLLNDELGWVGLGMGFEPPLL